MPVRLLRGNDTAVAGYYGSEGEVVVNTTNDSLHVLDGIAPGGKEIWNEDQVTSYVTAALTSYTSSGGSLPSSSVVYATETWVDSRLPTAGTASDPNTEAVQWDGTNFYISTLPVSSSGGGSNPATYTTDGSVVVWTSSGWSEDNRFAFTTYVDQEVADLKNEILGGATAAYDTLQEIKGFIDTNATDIGTLLTSMSTKAPVPGSGSTTTEALAWDATGSQFIQRDLSIYSQKPGVGTGTNALGWDAVTDQFITVDLSIYALNSDLANKADIGTAATYTNLGLVETELGNLAPKPALASGIGEFLRWDGSANGGLGGFINQVPSGSGGTSIPTPTVDTDTANGEVLVWDQTLGSLKNTASSFALNPPTQSTSNTYLYHDGTSWQYGTPVGSGSLSAPASGVTPAGAALTWDGTDVVNTTGFATETWVNTGIATKADTSALTSGLATTESNANTYTDGQVAPKADKPTTPSSIGEFLTWDGSDFVNATPSGVPYDTPVAPTGNSEFVKWDGNDFVNSTLSVAGYTDMGSITPPSASVGNEVLQWDGTDFVNVSGFATETYVTNKMPTNPSNLTEVVQWNGSAFVNATGFAKDSDITDRMPVTSTSTGSVVTWNGTRLENTVGMATEAYVDGLKPANLTGSSEVIKWNGSAFENSALSTTGFTTTGFITPATTSGTTDVLQWDGSNFINQAGFATETFVNTAITNLINGATSAYDTLIEIENAITANDTDIASLLSDLSLKAPKPTSAEITGDGEFLGWDGSAFEKKSISVSGGAFDIVETNNEIVFNPNYTVIGNATGVFEIVDNGSEYVIRPKAGLVA